jgi:hypothetical protein
MYLSANRAVPDGESAALNFWIPTKWSLSRPPEACRHDRRNFYMKNATILVTNMKKFE